MQIRHVYDTVKRTRLVNDDIFDSCTSANTVGLNISHMQDLYVVLWKRRMTTLLMLFKVNHFAFLKKQALLFFRDNKIINL